MRTVNDWATILSVVVGIASIVGMVATIAFAHRDRKRLARFFALLFLFLTAAVVFERDAIVKVFTWTPPPPPPSGGGNLGAHKPRPLDQEMGKQIQKPRQEGQTMGASTVSGAAEIASVGPISPKAWQKIAIKGTHFAMGQPFNGCSDFIRVTDLTDNRVFGPFAPGGFCYGPLLVSSWTDTQIVIEGFPSFKQGQDAFKIGDVIKVEVANFTQERWVNSGVNFRGAPVAWSSVTVTSEGSEPSSDGSARLDDTNKPQLMGANAVSGGAEIASVGPISPRAWQTIVIKGAHFAMGQPFNGCSDFIRVTNLTDNRVFGPFAPGRWCYSPIFVRSWTDTEIVIEGFPSFKRGQDAFKIGDVIKIEVANFTQTGWVSSGVTFSGAPVAWCSVRVGPQQ